ncbi:sugar ABC transporter ATP-binding protein [Streptomyces adelaidensis]|uniref:sugar ABC transporter ATP-binding protein n=1 Tax=Streptomyces adelaidensis TaxID=2796465 RepID=UPI0019031BB3|nr:sugar ABC transporter ATP-binding protein [Streptomyces adelaidensis]
MSSGISVLRLRSLSKTFPGTRALSDVSLDVHQGEVHALMGQNGSGKSTLIKILAGYYHADHGAQAWLDDAPVALGVVAASRHDRLRFVHQDLGLILELSAMDNLALLGGFARRPGRIDWAQQRRTTEAMLSRFGADIDVRRPLTEATPVQRTIVAIAAALAGWEGGRGVLVLDEPTAVLPHTEVERLLQIVRELRRSGSSVLYVSHRLDEIFQIADRVTVLRDGSVAATTEVAGLTRNSLAELMVGSAVNADYRAGSRTGGDGEVVLRGRGLRARYLAGVDVELRAGEVLGIAGLPGSGMEELPHLLAGEAPDGPAAGEVQLPGSSAAWWSVGDTRRPRLPIVPADRGREGVIAEFTVAENLSLSVLGKLGCRGRLLKAAERELVDTWTRRVQIKAASTGAVVTSLSGGNQQKVVLARCLAAQAGVLVLSEPTAGVDIGTREAIYDLIAEQAAAGLAVVVSSTDAGDLVAMCHRVLVLGRGTVVAQLEGNDISERAMMSVLGTGEH